MTADREALRTTTARLRKRLDAIETATDKAHGLLDEVEMAAGLVDANGRRFDEPCLSCKQVACRCPGGGREPRKGG